MVEPLPKRFNTREYERIAQADAWPEDARLELLEGEIYEMTPIGPSHAYRVLSLHEQFVLALGAQAVVLSQSPVHLSEYSEPEPDLALLKPPKARYQERLAEAGDVLLLVEVSDATLAFDRDKKLPLYARAGIPEVWLVNLQENQLEAYRRPRNGRYSELKTYAEGEAIAPQQFDAAIRWWE